jgi:hypothetical protein
MGITLPHRRVAVPALSLAVLLSAAAVTLAPNVKATGIAQHPSRVAHAARTVSISETATLRLVGRLGHVLNERGTATGTYSGSIEARLVAITGTTGEATITVYTRGGSLKARAITRAHPVGPLAYFRGTAVILSGTGSWSHASGSLSFTGKLDRQNFHATAEMRGTLHV